MPAAFALMLNFVYTDLDIRMGLGEKDEFSLGKQSRFGHRELTTAVERISVAGASSPIRLDRHIGQATDDRAKEIKRQECNIASDNEAVLDQLAAPAE